jgi:hypothetical protein
MSGIRTTGAQRVRVIPALLALLTLAPVVSDAALVNIGSGDSTGTSFFRGQAIVWIDPDGTGTIDAGDLFGQNYDGNFGPQTVFAAQSLTRDGATLNGRSQGVYGGFYAARNFAEIDVTNAVAGHQYYAVGGTGSKTAIRIFDPSELATRATFTWTVTGSSSIPAGVTGRATSRLDFGYSTDPGSDWLDLFFNPGTLNAQTFLGPGSYQVTVPLVLGEPLYLHFWSSAFTQVNPGEAPAGSSFRLTADFYSTFVLESVALFDDDDNPILDSWTAESEEGVVVFTPDGRVDGIDPAPPLPQVPLPAPAGLLAAAVAGLGLARRRLAAA